MNKNRMFKHLFTGAAAVLFCLAFLPAEDTASTGFSFGLGMDLGVESFTEADGTDVTYQKIGFVPDFSFGKFGISLDLSFHIASSSDPDQPFDFRKEDWVPTGDTTFLQLYLSKFNYIRYGLKGDPLYVKLGNITDGTLGTGFIMANYNNTLFQPNEKLFGMSADIDGSLFNFPYVGMESFIGNVAHPDVMGLRLYVRPLMVTSIPVFKNLEVGLTAAGDRDPGYRDDYFAYTGTPYSVTDNLDGTFTLNDTLDSIFIWGIDLIQPILSNPVVSLAGFGSLVVEPNNAVGSMVGFGGRLVSFIPYVFQLRFLGEDFIPAYFDATYDIYRAQKYAVMDGRINVDPFVGWLASSGFSFLEDKLAFSASLDGPFAAIPSGPTSDSAASEYPHMRLVFAVAEGLLPGFFFDAYYDKQYITSFKEAFNPEGAIIGANINYKTGPAVITLAYDVLYDPATGDFVTTAKLMTSIGLF